MIRNSLNILCNNSKKFTGNIFHNNKAIIINAGLLLIKYAVLFLIILIFEVSKLNAYGIDLNNMSLIPKVY